MKKYIKSIFILILLPIPIKGYCQNVRIDTIKNVNPYMGYLRESDNLISLIANGKISEALKIYSQKGNFFQNGKNIKQSFLTFEKIIDIKNKRVLIIKTETNLPGDDFIPPMQLNILSILYLFPSKYNNLYNKINFEFPIDSNIKNHRFDMLFYKAIDEYETIKKIEAIPVPHNGNVPDG